MSSSYGLPHPVVRLLRHMEQHKQCMKWSISENNNKITLSLSWTINNKKTNNNNNLQGGLGTSSGAGGGGAGAKAATVRDAIWHKLQKTLKLSRTEDGGRGGGVSSPRRSAPPSTTHKHHNSSRSDGVGGASSIYSTPTRNGARPPLRRQNSLPATATRTTLLTTSAPSTEADIYSRPHNGERGGEGGHMRASADTPCGGGAGGRTMCRSLTLPANATYGYCSPVSVIMPDSAGTISTTYPNTAAIYTSTPTAAQAPYDPSQRHHNTSPETDHNHYSTVGPRASRRGGGASIRRQQSLPITPHRSTSIQAAPVPRQHSLHSMRSEDDEGGGGGGAMSRFSWPGASSPEAIRRPPLSQSTPLATQEQSTPDDTDTYYSRPGDSYDYLTPAATSRASSPCLSRVSASNSTGTVLSHSASATRIRITYRTEDDIERSLEDIMEMTRERTRRQLHAIRKEWNRTIDEWDSIMLDDPTAGSRGRLGPGVGEVARSDVMNDSCDSLDDATAAQRDITQVKDTVDKCLKTCDNILYRHSTEIT